MDDSTINMHKKKPQWKLILLISLFIFGLLAFAILSFPGVLCKNIVKEELESPDRLLKAIIFSRECGASAGFSAQVSVLDTHLPLPNEKGNIFIEDLGHNDSCSLNIQAHWLNPRHLVINYDPKVRVFVQKPEIYLWTVFFKQEKVTITYGALQGS